MIILKVTMSTAAAFLALALVVRADETSPANQFLTVLSTSTQAELPAKAADLVAQAGAKQQLRTTIEVVKAAVGLNPAAASLTVGSIAHATPAMAAVAAGTAASLVPDQAVKIARAAAAAAPQQAGKIVEAICRVLPANYSDVAEAVAEVVPGASKEILTGISTAIPTLQGPIDKVLLADKGSVPSVNKVLEQVEQVNEAMTTDSLTSFAGTVRVSSFDAQPLYVMPPSSIKPPYVAPPVSPINLNPGVGGVVPPGGRNYANP